MRKAKRGIAQIPFPASDINHTENTLNPAFNTNGRGLCPRELEQRELAALLPGTLVLGKERKVFKPTRQPKDCGSNTSSAVSAF